jgi:hypothetical protein
MKSFYHFVPAWRGIPWLLTFRATVFPVVFLAACLEPASAAHAQAAPSADRGGLAFSAGGTASGYYLGYGEQKLLGVSAFVDIDGRQHLGVEGEARWLIFHQTNEEQATTYTIGPRYSMYYGRFQPYVKGLFGVGQFTFPYSLAHDNCLVIAPGGGVDFRLTRRIRWRAVDFEYQLWPHFEYQNVPQPVYGQMSSYGLSTGLRIKIF